MWELGGLTSSSSSSSRLSLMELEFNGFENEKDHPIGPAEAPDESSEEITARQERKDIDPGTIRSRLMEMLEKAHYNGYAIRLEYFDREGTKAQLEMRRRLGLPEEGAEESPGEPLNIFLLLTGRQLREDNLGELDVLVVDGEGFGNVPRFYKGRIWFGLKTHPELQSWLDQVLEGRASFYVFKEPPLPPGKLIEVSTNKRGDLTYIKLEKPILDPDEAVSLLTESLEYSKRRKEELKKREYDVAKAALDAFESLFENEEKGEE